MQLILQFKQTASNSESEVILFFQIEVGWEKNITPIFEKGKRIQIFLILKTTIFLKWKN